MSEMISRLDTTAESLADQHFNPGGPGPIGLQMAVSISEHKKNPMATVAAGEGMAVAVLNRNQPAFYCVPARAYEELMVLVEDLELGRIADARLADGQEPLRVSLDAL